jgi:hypothetical protein
VKSGRRGVFNRGVGPKINGNGAHHRDTEDTENFASAGNWMCSRELLNQLRFMRSDILRFLLSDDDGPTYRRDLPGDIWGTLRVRTKAEKQGRREARRNRLRV